MFQCHFDKPKYSCWYPSGPTTVLRPLLSAASKRAVFAVLNLDYVLSGRNCCNQAIARF